MQPVPAAGASVRSQGLQIGCGDNREVDLLVNMVSSSVYAVYPSGAHRTRLGLTFPIHQVINHQRPARRGEQLAQPDGSGWCIARIQINRTFDKFVVLQSRTGRKMAT